MTTETQISYEDLPLWMRQAKQEFDWGILIIIAMSLAIGWSFLINSELPAGHQLEHTIFQANDISTGFQEGIFYPRWSPYAVKGYGAPIPNYYPMGASYTIAVVSALFTNDLFQATRLVFVFAYVMAGIGIYLYLSRRTDSAIGLLGSVLYLYSPMIGSTVPYVMGDLALLIASGLFTLILWASYRLTTFYQPSDLALYTLLLAFLIWMHPPMAIISVILTTVLVPIEQNEISRVHRLIRLFIGHIIGGLLITFFWMPALFERGLVDWYTITEVNQLSLSLDQLFAPMQQIDSGLLLPQPQFKLGWILLGFMIIGLAVGIRNKELRPFSLFFAIATILLTGYSLIVTPEQTWLLVPITLFVAIIASQTLYLRRYVSPRRKRLFLAISIATSVIFSQPVWLVPPPNMAIASVDAVSQIRFEQQNYIIPPLPDHVPMPSSIDINTPVNRALVNSYTLEAPQRYDDRQNNANTILSLLTTETHQQVYRAFNQFPTELEFLLPYFDGWQAYLDGVPIPTFANPNTQLLMIRLPIVADGELIIKLIATPIRQLAWFISGLALFVLVFINFIRSRQSNVQNSDLLIKTLPRTDIRLMLVMFVSLGVAIIVFASEASPFQLQTQPTFTLSQSLPLQSRTSAGLEASTFTISQTTARINDDIVVTLYWQALTDIPTNYHSRIWLRSAENGVIWYTSDLQPIGRVGAQRWLRNFFMSNQHTIFIPDDIFAGNYEAVIEAFPCSLDCDLNSPVTFFDRSGEQIGQQLIIPLSITIR